MPKSPYYFQKTESGSVYAAAGCRLGEATGFLVVSPDQRVAQLTGTVAHMRPDVPELARLLFWKAVMTFGRNLPVVREARMQCEACGAWSPTGVYDPAQLCLACKDYRLVPCTSCAREVRAESCIEGRCLSCWTVTSLLRRCGEASAPPRGTFDEERGEDLTVKRPHAARRSRRVVMVRSAPDPEEADEGGEAPIPD